jgi:hypothetical protein
MTPLLNRDKGFWNDWCQTAINVLNRATYRSYAMTPEIKFKIETLRAKINRGEEVSMEEMQEAVQLYRDARGAVSSNIEKKKAAPPKTKKAAPSGDDLLDGFLGAGNE